MSYDENYNSLASLSRISGDAGSSSATLSCRSRITAMKAS